MIDKKDILPAQLRAILALGVLVHLREKTQFTYAGADRDFLKLKTETSKLRRLYEVCVRIAKTRQPL